MLFNDRIWRLKNKGLMKENAIVIDTVDSYNK